MTPIVEFMFLKFPENPIQRMKFTDKELKEFEDYLTDLNNKLSNFTVKDASSNLAARQDYPEKGFGGPLVCSKCKSPNELKNDGSKRYCCPMKFPFKYYALCDEDDNIIRTSFEPINANETKGQYCVPRRFGGCPAFNKKP